MRVHICVTWFYMDIGERRGIEIDHRRKGIGKKLVTLKRKIGK